jgi:two-component system chemotaxis response regulator CheB
VKIQVLVVDDSGLMRRIISDFLEADPRIEVMDTARDGYEAVQKVAKLHPDVVTMDIEMPRMSGLEALRRIMSQCPTPVIVLTGLTDPELVIEALEKGAVDFIIKPSGTVSVDIYQIRQELIAKVKLATLANLPKRRLYASQVEPTARPQRSPFLTIPPNIRPISKATSREAPEQASPSPAGGWVVVVGASAGGPRTLDYLLGHLPSDLPAPVLVVQHMPPGFTRTFAERLHQHSSLAVKEAVEGDVVRPGQAYIAPGDHHMLVEKQRGKEIIRLDKSPRVKGLRPAADVTMCSVAEAYGAGSIGVILTGMGSDGTEGFRAIKGQGGITIAQDKATSVIYGMPRAALRSGCVDTVLPLDEIPEEIVRILTGRDHG